MKITEITPYPKNAKQHRKKQVEQIAASIKEFGFNQPIVVDKKHVIIVGHGRYEAAKMLGMDDVPVEVVDLNEEQAKAYRLADNKLNESKWDMPLVIAELKELSLPMLELTGFGLDTINDPEDDNFDVDAAIPEETTSKLGEVYKLGRHVLMCGDATNPEHVKTLMGGGQS